MKNNKYFQNKIPFVSIIVPVYNVADYLRRCFDSCVNQTLQEIEIIVVNDCSPDPRDSEIMREYEKKFPNKIKCIWHKENKRLGGARNTGIRAASGEFVYCLDSDDYIDLDLCKKMYNAIIAENADMAVCNTICVKDNVFIKNWAYDGANGVFGTSDLCERIKNLRMHSAWLIMIRKAVIENNNLYFPEQIEFEDLACTLWYMASQKIVRINEALHYYLIRKNSIVQEGKLETYILVIQTIKCIFSSDYFNNLDNSVRKMLFLYYAKHILVWCKTICVNYNTEFVKYCNSVLDLFKIYKVDYNDDIYMQSEENICSREILRFIEQNINMDDFNLEFAAYYEHQGQLKKMRRVISLYENKNLTIWGYGTLGRKNATNMNLLGTKFEITDINTKIHGEKVVGNIVVKPWDELKEHTDVVLVSARGIFENVYEKLAKECLNIEIVDLIELLQ
jgi:glycosyltransferase involved in cell wall biosynthesis